MREQCLNCLQSTTGYCGLHAPKQDYVSFTTTTSNARKYTKREVEEEVIYFSKRLCELKWYQCKKWAIRNLKNWVNFLKKFDKK